MFSHFLNIIRSRSLEVIKFEEKKRIRLKTFFFFVGVRGLLDLRRSLEPADSVIGQRAAPGPGMTSVRGARVEEARRLRRRCRSWRSEDEAGLT